MALNPRASKSGSANSRSEPGGIFQGKITLVYDDGTVRVFVRMLGINVGPCRIVSKQHDEEFVINDEVLVAYLDNLKGEMVVIGRLTDRPGVEAATTEPIGHEDKTESVISFNNSTRVFTIAPIGDSFNVWCVGKRYTKTAAESITLPATTGLYYIYYSSTGVLSSKTSFFTWDQDAPTAYVYYNSGTEEAEFFADERHGVTLDWATHEYLHRTRGASLAEGLGASGYTLAGTGSSNADMQISIENGTFFDEDLEVNITHSATPNANTWEQRLQSPAYIPMFYRFGSGGSWRLDTATAYPVKYGSTRATYNLSSGGTWSTPDMTSGKFGVTWIVATNNLNEPVIGILGQTVSDNIGQAEDVSYADLDLTGLPIVEIRPLYKLIYETNTGYTNAVKSRLAGIADIRANQAINIGIGASALSSLTDVSLTTPANNDVLKYDGSNWVNGSIPLDSASDVSIVSPSANQVLAYSGSVWENLSLVPTGSIIPYAGSSQPTGWLFCNGQQVLSSSALGSILSTTYNTGGETAGNVRVPDLRGRTIIAADTMSAGGVTTAAGRVTSNNACGNGSGLETHTLTEAELRAHTHTINHDHAAKTSGAGSLHSHTANHGHGHTISASSGGEHFHNEVNNVANSQTSDYYTKRIGGGGSNWDFNPANTTRFDAAQYARVHSSGSGHSHTMSGSVSDNNSVTTSGEQLHTHSVDLDAFTGTSGSTGSSSAHNNMQPYLVLMYIIKT